MKKLIAILMIVILSVNNVYASSLTSSTYAVSVGFNVDGSTQTTLSSYNSTNVKTPSDEGAATSLFGIYNRFTLSSLFQANSQYTVNVTYTFDDVINLNFIDNLVVALNSSNNSLSQFCSSTTSPDGLTSCFTDLDIDVVKVSDYALTITYKFIPKSNWGYVAIYTYPDGRDGYYNSDLRIVGNSYIRISNVNYTVKTDLNNALLEDANDKLDDVNDNIKDTNEKLDKIDETITDNTPPDTSSLENASGWLPAGPVDSIANLPITLLQSLTNNLDSSCTPIDLPIPFIDSSLILDCPGTILKKFDGFWIFWEGFGLIAGIWCLYKYFINLYKWVEIHLSMDEKESLGKWGGI